MHLHARCNADVAFWTFIHYYTCISRVLPTIKSSLLRTHISRIFLKPPTLLLQQSVVKEGLHILVQRTSHLIWRTTGWSKLVDIYC